MRRRHDTIILAIGVFKLVKATLLVVLGIGSLLHGHDAPHMLRTWANALGVDPRNEHLDHLVQRASFVDQDQFEHLGIGGLIYAALFAVEGTGLVLRKLWAEYVTIVITTSFIPLEIYEMVHGKSVLKGVIIAANVAIVAYLILRLRHKKHWPFR